MSWFICSTQATKRSRSRGQPGSRTRWITTPSPICSLYVSVPVPRVSTSTPTPWRTSASESLRTCRARPPSITGGYSQESMSTRLQMVETLSVCAEHSAPGMSAGRARWGRPVIALGLVDVHLQLARRGAQRLAGLSWPTLLGPVADHLAAARVVVVDAPVERLQRQAAGGRAVDDRVEATPAAVDLDDVARVDAFESHQPGTPARRAARRGRGHLGFAPCAGSSTG